MTRIGAGGDHSPVWEEDFPDPSVLRVADSYWAYGTNANGSNVQVLRSNDLVHWEKQADALPTLPDWVRQGLTWAPSVLPRSDGFVLYVTVRKRGSGRQAIMAAHSTSPGGPYSPVGSGPLIFQEELGGSIDPSPFVDGDDLAYLLWKADSNAIRITSTLWGQRLSSDGCTLVGSPTELLRSDRSWERPLVEAPALVRDGDRYYLFYSGGPWESRNYAIGYAVGQHPLGPWRKVTTGRPWFGSNGRVHGPGGQEFVTDPGGGLWMAYHGWEPGRVGYASGGRRTLRIIGVTFLDGKPVAGNAEETARRPGGWRRGT